MIDSVRGFGVSGFSSNVKCAGLFFCHTTVFTFARASPIYDTMRVMIMTSYFNQCGRVRVRAAHLLHMLVVAFGE